MTLGLFLFVLNGLCLWLTSALVIVSLVSWLLTAFLSDQGRIVVITRR